MDELTRIEVSILKWTVAYLVQALKDVGADERSMENARGHIEQLIQLEESDGDSS